MFKAQIHNEILLAASAGAAAVLFLGTIIFAIYKWKFQTIKERQLPPRAHLIHDLPDNTVLNTYVVEQKDSLEEHLNVLTRKLAEKEVRLQLSKTKIRETQNEIENLHPIQREVRFQYKDVMDNLRKDLMSNENECKKLQEQIEWVSRKRAELRDEVCRGQRIYGEAAAELAINLTEFQRGRVTEKPSAPSSSSLRHRIGPCPFPDATPGSIAIIKSNPDSPEAPLSRTTTSVILK